MSEIGDDPESTPSQRVCAMFDFLFEYAHEWTDRHLSSCKSYRKNNHFGRRLNKWHKIYNKGFGCDAGTTPEEKVQAALFLSTDSETNVPMVLGLDGESLKYFSFFQEFHNFVLSTQHIISHTDLAKLLEIFDSNSKNFIDVFRIC